MAGYIGARSVSLSTTVANAQDVTATDTTPEVTIINNTHEDTDGGREGKVIFKGQQSGGEESTLAEIQGSHDGTADDEKGDLIFKTNDGSDGASPTEAMRIDAEQNLGLGTNAPAHRLDIVESADAFGARITNNSDGSQGLQIRTSDNDTGQYILDLQTSSSATGTDYASKFVVEKGGNVGIGTTSIDVSTQAGGSGYRALQIESDEGGQLNFDHNDAGTGSTLGQINFQRAGEVVAEIEGVTDGATDNGRLAFRTQPDGGALTERMRLDHDGNLNIGTTSAPSAGSGGSAFKVDSNGRRNLFLSTSSSNNQGLIYFLNPNGEVGSITTNGSATAYNTSSDYRLKENVSNISDGITRVKQLAPKRFNFIADADTTVDGFLAHEAQAVVPEAITGTKDEVDDNGDAVMQGIDQSKLVPLLTAALQEAIAKIETLETKVTALEAE